MASDIEERVRRLERFRFRALGMMNAQATMLMDLWMQFLETADDAAVNDLAQNWLSDAERAHEFPGADPAELDLISQEYRDALTRLLQAIHQKRSAGRRSSHPRKDG